MCQIVPIFDTWHPFPLCRLLVNSYLIKDTELRKTVTINLSVNILYFGRHLREACHIACKELIVRFLLGRCPLSVVCL